jgi:hypothetical protein
MCLALPEGFEPPTPAFVAQYSNPLSYGSITVGGELGIRTLDTGLSPYASLAGRCLRPLGQLTMMHGALDRIRTGVPAVKGQCPRPLDDESQNWLRKMGVEPNVFGL